MKVDQVLTFLKEQNQIIDYVSELPRYTIGNYDKETQYFDRRDVLALKTSWKDVIDNYVPTYIIQDGKGYYEQVASDKVKIDDTTLFLYWEEVRKLVEKIDRQLPFAFRKVKRYTVMVKQYMPFYGVSTYNEVKAALGEYRMQLVMNRAHTINLYNDQITDLIPEIIPDERENKEQIESDKMLEFIKDSLALKNGKDAKTLSDFTKENEGTK